MSGRVPHRPIRLDYLITDLQTGGVPLHLFRLASRLPRDQFDIRVISLSDVGPVGEKLQSSNIRVEACGAYSVWQIQALVRLFRFLVNDPPDILHSLLFHANIAARLIGPLAGVNPRRIVTEIQTAEIERRWHLVVDNLTCRLCRCEIGNSPSVIQHLHHMGHIPYSRLTCRWGAVDIEAFDQIQPVDKTELGLPPDEPVIIWTGRLDPVKGFEEMLAAFDQVRDKRPAHFLIVGDGPYRPSVERIISDRKLNDRVHLLGQRDYVPALLKMADLFLFCSRTEGLPNALLEAMAAGLPIITSDVPGCRDLIQHQKTGLLVPSGSVDAIAQSILNLLEQPSKMEQLGRRARQWVVEHADVRSWVERWVNFYKLLLP
jgi:glycosyltransferase involved in cell wall biosynthesis